GRGRTAPYRVCRSPRRPASECPLPRGALSPPILRRNRVPPMIANHGRTRVRPCVDMSTKPEGWQRVLSAGPLALVLLIASPSPAPAGERIELTAATIVVRSGVTDASERIAPAVLQEEVFARTGIRWPIESAWPRSGAVIAIGVAGET